MFMRKNHLKINKTFVRNSCFRCLLILQNSIKLKMATKYIRKKSLSSISKESNKDMQSQKFNQPKYINNQKKIPRCHGHHLPNTCQSTALLPLKNLKEKALFDKADLIGCITSRQIHSSLNTTNKLIENK